MVDWKKAIQRIPDEIRDKFEKWKKDYQEKYKDRPDIARVRSFRKAVGLDAASSRKEYWDTYRIKTDKWLGEDDDFRYRKITMTASGVNLNRQFKPPEEIEKVGDLQADWTIPMLNDHPMSDDPLKKLFTGPRLDPEDDEISGFCVIIGAEEVDGEMELHAYEAVPKWDETAQKANTYSIGYYADEEVRKGVYKGQVYDAVQKNLFIIHNARMVTQTASTPRAKAHDEGDAEWTTAYINDLPDAAFAYIEPGGSKDEDGKTTPRSLRHFPHHDKSVKNGTENDSVDLPHLRNALARGPQSKVWPNGKSHLEAHAEYFGIGGRGKDSKTPGGANMPTDDVEALKKTLADKETELSKARKENDAAKEKIAGLSSDLKKAKDEVSKLQDRIKELEESAKELDAIKKERIDTLRSLVVENCPGSEDNGSAFSDDELAKMDEAALRLILKAAGVESDKLKFHLVKEDETKSEDNEDEPVTPGVPGRDGKWPDEE